MNKYYKIECEFQKDLILGLQQDNHLFTLNGTITINEEGLAKGIVTNAKTHCKYLVVGFVDTKLGLTINVLNLDRDKTTRSAVLVQALASPTATAFAGEFYQPGTFLAQHLGYCKVVTNQTYLSENQQIRLIEKIDETVREIDDPYLADRYYEKLWMEPTSSKQFLEGLKELATTSVGPYSDILTTGTTAY